MGIALGIIGMLATIAGIVLLIIALVKKRGWGVTRSLVILVVGIILFFVGVFTTPTPEGVSPTPPAETPPATSEVGKSRSNPVPFGSSLTYGDQRVTVLSSQRLTQIGTGWLADTPKEGHIYLVVKLKIDFLGDPSEIHHLYEWDFDVVGDSGYVYEYEWLVETDTPLQSGDYYGGATTSGDLVYEIKQTETNMVLIWHCGLVADRFLEIP
jgi:hypothetical protein